MSKSSEEQAIIERYKRRAQQGSDDRNDLVLPARHLAHQEKERAFLRLLGQWDRETRSRMRMLEIGCGSGDNLLQFLRWGFSPENLVGNELIAERCSQAIHQLPAAIKIIPGDARSLKLEPASFDVVLQSTVFTSILEDDFQQELADHIWSLVKPGGGVLWYDFAFNNPRNPDVRGVSLARIHRLFSEGAIRSQRITLAPPLARLATAIHPIFYGLANALPLLRSHLFCWIHKSAASAARRAA